MLDPSRPCRVINMGSSTASIVSSTRWSAEGVYGGRFGAYCYAKYCQALVTRQLALSYAPGAVPPASHWPCSAASGGASKGAPPRQAGLTIYSVHPGIVLTALTRHDRVGDVIVRGIVGRCLWFLFLSPSEAAEMVLATTLPRSGGGPHLPVQCREIPSGALVHRNCAEAAISAAFEGIFDGGRGLGRVILDSVRQFNAVHGGCDCAPLGKATEDAPGARRGCAP